jgi:sodium pump decarboxylase gamma subunit
MQGLTISLIGMGLTFLALGLLILAMILLERFFREEEPVEEAVPQEEISVSAQAETEAEEIAVAIATALAYWRSVSQSGLGTTLEAEPSPWWVMGRARQYPAAALQKIRRN